MGETCRGWPGTQVVKVVVNLSKSGEDSGIRDLRGMYWVGTIKGEECVKEIIN